MAHAWWRDADYELFDRLTRERDEARALYRETEEKYAREVSAHDKTAQERDALKATVNDALEQLRHEEHLRTTAERAIAEAAERLDEFGACPTVADGIQAMRLRLVEARAEVDEARAGLVQYDERLAVERGRAKGTMAELRNCHDELVAARADAARLREALEFALTQGWNGQHSSLCFSGEPYTGCTCPPWVQQARAALAMDGEKP